MEKDNANAHNFARLAFSDSDRKPFCPFDLQIAAHTCSLGLTLVTRNVGEFERVPELNVEDWYPAES